MSSDPLKKCPSCKKSKLERLIGTGAGVIIKGSGFYQTDYRGDSYAKDAKKDSESSSKPTGDSSKPTTSSTPASGSSDAPSGSSTPKKTSKQDD